MIRLQGQLEALQEMYPYLADDAVLSKLKIRLDDDQVNKLTDKTNICFVPRNRGEKQMFGEAFLNHDLQQLGLSIVGSLQSRRERLRSVLEHFYRNDVMGRTIQASKYPGAFITVRQAIPCILHLENRCGEIIIKLLLLEGYNRENITKSQQEQLRLDVEEVVNTRVLGTPSRKSSWRVNTAVDKDNRKVISDQSMPNTHVRKFLNHFEELSELCIIDEERLEEWNEVISLWINLMEFARKRSDFTEDEIIDFQDQADDFFDRWIDLKHRDWQLFSPCWCWAPILLPQRVGQLILILSAGLGEYELLNQDFLLQEDSARRSQGQPSRAQFKDCANCALAKALLPFR